MALCLLVVYDLSATCCAALQKVIFTSLVVNLLEQVDFQCKIDCLCAQMLYFTIQVCLQRVAKPVGEMVLGATTDGFESGSEPQIANVESKSITF